MTPASANGRKQPPPAFNIALACLMTIVLGLSSWMAAKVQSLAEEVAAIKANRFTATDGLEVWKEISDIKSMIPGEVPPQWFLDRVAGLELVVTRLSDKIDTMSEKLVRIEGKQ